MTGRARLAQAALVAALAAAAAFAWPTGPRVPDVEAVDDASAPGVTPADAGGPADAALRGTVSASVARRGRPEHAVDGIVLRDGVAVAGVAVEVWARARATDAFAGVGDVAVPPVGAAVRTTVTDAAGRFAVEALVAGAYAVVARAEDAVDGAHVAFDPAHPPTRAPLRLDLVATAAVEGRIVTPDAARRFSTAVADAGGVRVRAAVGDDGRFRLEGLPVGRDAHVQFFAVTADACVHATVRVPHAGPWVVHVPTTRDVVGRVVDARTLTPLAGARVAALWEDAGGYGVARTVARPDGSFAVRAAVARELRVGASADGHADDWAAVVGQASVELTLAPLVHVEARVVAPGGASVRGVRVVLAQATDGATTDARVVDDDGNVAFDVDADETVGFGVDGGAWALAGVSRRGETIEAPVSTFELVATVDGAPVRLDLHVVPGRSLHGRVVYDDDLPAVGARVRATRAGDAPCFGTPDAITDGDGRFDLHGVPPAALVVMAVRASDARPKWVAVEPTADGAYPPTTVRVLRVARDLATLEVRDAVTGDPVRGASVVGDGRAFTTGSDGTVRRTLEELSGAVVVSAEGYVPREVVWASATCRVALGRGVVVAGHLRLDDGTPVPGASVSLVAPGATPRTTAPEADGSFRFPAVAPTRCRLVVHPLGGGAAVLDEELDATADRLDLRVGDDALRAADAVRVHVRDADGADVARCALRVRGRGRGDAMGVEGAVVLVARPPVDASATTFVVEGGVRHRDGTALARRVVPFPARDAAVEVTLAPVRPVEGRVEAPEGVAVDVEIVVAPYDVHVERDGDAATRAAFGGGGWAARADASGRFALWDVPEDGCVVAAKAGEGLCAVPVRVTPGDRDVRLVVRRAPVVTLRVVDARGAPVLGAFVGAHDAGASAWRAGTRTDADGRVALPGLDPTVACVLVVDATASGHPLLRRERWLPHDEVIALAESGVVAGTVLGPGGEVVESAGVWWRQDDTWRWTWADASGRFHVTGLDERPVWLAADVSGAAVENSWTSPVEVAVGRTDVRLAIAEGDVLTVRLDGPSPDGASFWFAVDGDDEHWWQASFVDATTVRLCRCDPTKTYLVWSPPAADGTVVCVGGLRAPGEARVRRRPGGQVTVRVRDADASSVKVEARRGLLVRPGELEEDGAFHVRGLPDGPLRVRVTATLEGGEVVVERTASIGDRVDVSLGDARRR